MEDWQLPELKNLLITAEAILFLLSGTLLAIAALIYFIIPQAQDVEGKCTFHLILIQSLFYFFGAYARFARKNGISLVNDLCITHHYIFVFIQLCIFTWSALISYHMWSRFRQNSRSDDSKLKKRFLIIGYGIPALLVVLCNIHAHGYSLFTKNGFEDSCEAHRDLLFSVYAAMPIIIVELICAFFSLCVQRELWTMQTTNLPEYSTSSPKKYKYRLLLNTKLFALTGLPWLFIIFCSYLQKLIHSELPQYCVNGIIFFISFEGIVLFYILVVSRKRIHRGLAEKFGITMRKWQWDPDCEESTENCDDYEDNESYSES